MPGHHPQAPSTLPSIWRTALASALLLLCGWAAGAWLTLGYQVWTDEGARRLQVARQPVPVPPVTVQDSSGALHSLPTLLTEQGVSIVDFFYTRCETVCLSLGSSFQQLQAALQAEPATGVRLLSISFDGARDQPADLAAYAQRLQADPTRWRLVRLPDASEQQALLARLGVVVVPDGRGDFEHNAALLVLDGAGRMVRVFDLAEQELALNYARHLAQVQAGAAP